MIACTDLEIRIGYRPLFRSLKFVLSRHETLALVGPNGCGKTTLLRSLAGLVRPSNGSIFIHGKTLWPQRAPDVMNSKVLYLNTQPAFYLDHTVSSQLELMCNAFTIIPSHEQMQAALHRVGLTGRAKQVVRTLSTGQKRRLSLAVIPLIQPDIILADEPTNGLDIDGLRLSLQMFEAARASGAAIVAATHDDKLIEFCKQVLDVSAFVPPAKMPRDLKQL